MNLVERKQIAVVGFGPAGLAATLAAHAAGFKRIAAVDPGSRLGAGGLDRLDILGNSSGTDATELLPLLFPEAAKLAPAIDLSTRPELVKIPEIADLLAEVAVEVEKRKIVEVVRESASTVTRLPNGYEIKTANHTIQSDWFVLANGGQEKLIKELADRNAITSPGSVFTTHDVLANVRNGDLEAFLAGRNQIAIVGNSHGAYSVARKLLENYPGITIDIFKRAPTKPFFESVDEAEVHGYNITSIDSICPERGYVNRYDGIRGLARELYFQEERGELEGQLRSLYNVSLDKIDSEVAVVQATGFTARSISLVDESNKPIDYVTRPTTQGFANIYEGEDGPLLPNAIAIGLGHSGSNSTNQYRRQAIDAFQALR